jgi:hypothetical protein
MDASAECGRGYSKGGIEVHLIEVVAVSRRCNEVATIRRQRV